MRFTRWVPLNIPVWRSVLQFLSAPGLAEAWPRQLQGGAARSPGGTPLMCKVVCNAPPQLVVLRFAKASPGVGLLRSHIAPVTCHELSRCAFAILHINSTLPAAAGQTREL